jgi:hypothetical protein
MSKRIGMCADVRSQAFLHVRKCRKELPVLLTRCAAAVLIHAPLDISRRPQSREHRQRGTDGIGSLIESRRLKCLEGEGVIRIARYLAFEQVLKPAITDDAGDVCDE